MFKILPLHLTVTENMIHIDVKLAMTGVFFLSFLFAILVIKNNV